MNKLEARVAAIEERNRRVELDKGWETSWTRRITIAILTYGVVVTYLFAIGNDKPFVNSFVPVGGFLLSTLALQSIKNWWESKEKQG
jgi:hypothetical protein